MGLKDSEWGQMGVIMMAGTLGWIMDAPAATAYAVLPVGVDTINPGGAESLQNPFRTESVGPGGTLTVSLHRGDEVSVQEEVYVGQVGGGASVHHHIIQNLKNSRRLVNPPNTPSRALALRTGT